MTQIDPHRMPGVLVATLLALLAAMLIPSGRTADATGPGSPWRASTPRDCTGQALLSDYISGTLTCAAAQRLTIRLAGPASATVAVPLGASTQVCRAARGCRATWRDLRAGDVLDVSIAAWPSGEPVARWVDANMAAGYGTIRARTAHSLTLTLERRGNLAGRTRILLVSPWTLITAGPRTYAGSTGGLQSGQSVYFTASAEGSRLLTARLWAVQIFLLERPHGASLDK